MRRKLSTKLVHLPDLKGEAEVSGTITPPIFQTSTFVFDSAEQGGKRFAGDESGYIYSRLSNPTVNLLEEAIAELEGADEGIAFASGMAAISGVLMALVHTGDHVLVSRGVYGCTYGLLELLQQRFHVDYTLADLGTESAVRAAVTANTKVIYIETPMNPTMELVDIAACCRVAKEIGATVVVDNTFATPVLQRPIELGADIVIHSATKYLGGHGDVIMGLAAGPREIMSKIRMTTQKDIGGIAAPFNAWLVLRGMKTLDLRMNRHCGSALEIANRIQGHPAVTNVYYPGLSSFAQRDLYERQMSAAGGVIGFTLGCGYQSSIRFMNKLRLCKRAVSLGEVHTLVQHPASMTHSLIPKTTREQMGIDDTFIRLSVGIEDVDDIWDDLEQALAACSE
ncbi:trans-sulfuration enzyme family protein [Alicyclobacillus fastidiosus]|uniref:PLP-dependent aspartate aminotransferase family protein n=1 Tax=Alicyclobacillus fastidiosus TaxID=392011 RepID=A0ABV5AL62_9BACL|nr:PLP-dependent aspartate aminotransferase family protein [Alicyclobacillus fastidiosus]WEH09039.1 PLP-dependent aspartate aminotransferase family protein [Alicyclobacillus fastidiosus]